MRRLLLVLFLAFAACSERKEEAKTAPPAVAEAPGAIPASMPAPAPAPDSASAGVPASAPLPAAIPDAKPVASSPAPAGTLTPPAAGDRIALRMYEHLLNGRRAATMRVEWKAVERDGRRLVEDTTETVSREDRDMSGYVESFESESISRTLRTEGGEMVSQETVTTMPGRTDKSWVERTPAGYHVRVRAGDSEEAFDVATDKPVMVDAEAFLAGKIRSGEATPGATFEIPLLGGKRVVTSALKVVGPDDEGPGLKVVETTEGNDTLWWFAEDGSVVRLRIGVRVIRRDDGIRQGDLPKRAAQFRITLPADPELPRIFTTREMLVDVTVRTDETTKPPKIPESPFTEVKERTDDRVTLLLRSNDDPKATCPLPIDPKGFEEYLKATALMEVDSPRARDKAKDIVGDATDAREAARRIADFVFTYLKKGSSKLAQPTMLQILDDRMGDCSEHALLFTGLCRAAGIPVRQCSGYVNIGSDWGAHSWCEVWVGRWIGADPTTNEIGTRARYILLARPDEPVEAGRITPERTSIRIRRAVYADGTLDLEGEEEPDPELFSGIRLAELPEGWEAERGLMGMQITGPGFTVFLSLHADHGYRSMQFLTRRMRGGKVGGFGGRPAAVSELMPVWLVPLGREILQVAVQTRPGGSTPDADQLAKVLAPTLDREE
ncbi:MAG TPA: transglutaminase-like domain-containing protein [Planctomycetota bacterium]|nr:transglutaminase-like domain-containing protein [Planctomycetota bacterium]